MYENFAELESLWVEAGGSQALAPLMAAIAMAESSGYVGNVNSADPNGGSFGLWQINGIHGYNTADLLSSPLYNAQAAVAVFNSQGLGAWSTFTSWLHHDGQHGDQVISSLLGPYSGQTAGLTQNTGGSGSAAPGGSNGPGTVQISPQALAAAVGAIAVAALAGLFL